MKSSFSRPTERRLSNLITKSAVATKASWWESNTKRMSTSKLWRFHRAKEVENIRERMRATLPLSDGSMPSNRSTNGLLSILVPSDLEWETQLRQWKKRKKVVLLRKWSSKQLPELNQKWRNLILGSMQLMMQPRAKILTFSNRSLMRPHNKTSQSVSSDKSLKT